jgi:hypothetical protein
MEDINMALSTLRDVYNPLAKKENSKSLFESWKDSVPVVLLSDALKIVGKKHGIRLRITDDGRPSLLFNPGLNKKDIGSERWSIAEQVSELFVDAIDDLILLMKYKKIELPKKDDVFKRRVK